MLNPGFNKDQTFDKSINSLRVIVYPIYWTDYCTIVQYYPNSKLFDINLEKAPFKRQ